MGETTGIAWTNKTWNPWRGCTRVSAGCKNCYMFSEQTRYGQDPSTVLRTKTWADPLKWQKAALARGATDLVFTCSWSDWFHKDADPWRDEAWAVVKSCPNLIFQVLTKRPERIAQHLPADWGAGYPNVWLGVSVEDQPNADKRIPELLKIPAAIRFLSLEPLIGPVDLGLEGIVPKTISPQYQPTGNMLQWAIIGGESGPGARVCRLEWIRDLLWQCQRAGLTPFVKQLGSAPIFDQDETVRYIRDRKGGDIEEWPEDLRVRKFPRPDLCHA